MQKRHRMRLVKLDKAYGEMIWYIPEIKEEEFSNKIIKQNEGKEENNSQFYNETEEDS